MVKPPGRPNMALADFTAPRDTGLIDYVGAFAVTAGHRLDEVVAEFEAAHDDYSAIMARALADRLAEAFAERLHEVVRRELWGYASRRGSLSNEDLIAERYQGIRPAPGYPACPDHTEKGPLFDLLGRRGARRDPADRIVRDAPGGVGQRLLLLAPAGGLLRARPDRSATSSRTTRDRKGMPVDVMARWLAPNLAED